MVRLFGGILSAETDKILKITIFCNLFSVTIEIEESLLFVFFFEDVVLKKSELLVIFRHKKISNKKL